MKTQLKTFIITSSVAALTTMAAVSAFAQVTAPGAGTTATPAMRPVPPHLDRPGDHPRGTLGTKATTGVGADDPQTPALRPMPMHNDKPGDHSHMAPQVKSTTGVGADDPQTPAHVEKPGMASDHKH